MIEYYKAQVAWLKEKAKAYAEKDNAAEVARLNFEIKNYEAEIDRLESK
jgi:hypothetical protein